MVGSQAAFKVRLSRAVPLRRARLAMPISKAKYESVCLASNRLAVVSDHENSESAAVISECSRFAVIHKAEGWGLRTARETDSRKGSRGISRRPA